MENIRKGCLHGILRKGYISSYSSLIMLIPGKLTGVPRIVTNFRYLKLRVFTFNLIIHLVRHKSPTGYELFSVIDLRGA